MNEKDLKKEYPSGELVVGRTRLPKEFSRTPRQVCWFLIGSLVEPTKLTAWLAEIAHERWNATLMTAQSPANFNTFSELKNYIHAKLCELEQLDIASFPLSQQSLKQRGDQVCGYLFSIYGPRSVVFNAVLETVNNAIHFYNSSGERVSSESISNIPPLDC